MVIISVYNRILADNTMETSLELEIAEQCMLFI